MALEGMQGKKNTTKYKPFGFCHKWIIFKTNQLMSYLCTEKINISKCDRQSNRLFHQFSPKVIFIHNRQVCSPVFSTYTWTASYRKWHNTNRCKNTKYLQQKTIILLLKENLVAGGQNFLPRSFAFLSLTFTCLLTIPLLSKVTEITKQGKIYWNLAMGCYYISQYLSIFFKLDVHGILFVRKLKSKRTGAEMKARSVRQLIGLFVFKECWRLGNTFTLLVGM